MEYLITTYGLFTVLAVILALIIQIYTLIRQAKKKQWVWFVLTLVFNVTWIIYWIIIGVKKVN